MRKLRFVKVIFGQKRNEVLSTRFYGSDDLKGRLKT